MVAPTVHYFGKEHLPFAILAIAVLSTLIALPPLLLLIYPTKTFQKLLGCLKITWPALHIFSDVFQGCYRNRTDGRFDYRYFAALYFILRVVIFLVRTLKPEVLSRTTSAVVLVIGSLLFALLRPYKKNWLNILDSLILALLVLISLWIVYCLETQEKWFQSVGLLTALPLVFLLFTQHTDYFHGWEYLRNFSKSQKTFGSHCSKDGWPAISSSRNPLMKINFLTGSWIHVSTNHCLRMHKLRVEN